MTDSGSIGSITAQCAALIAPYAGRTADRMRTSLIFPVLKGVVEINPCVTEMDEKLRRAMFPQLARLGIRMNSDPESSGQSGFIGSGSDLFRSKSHKMPT